MLRTVHVLVVLGLVMAAMPCQAHPIIVDASAADWPLITAAQGNLGHICRGAGPIGEYIWVDVAHDERTDFSTPDSRVDLTEFRVTADQENLYFLAKMLDIPDQATGNGAPQVQVAIDVNQDGSGSDWLGGYADTQVDPLAYWEYLIITRFGSGSPTVTVWYDGWIGPFAAGVEAISGANDVIEFLVPWTALEGLPRPAMLRCTVTTYRANTVDDTWDTGPGVSDALDAVTNYGDPGDVWSNTWVEVSDQVVNSFFDIFIESSNEPGPPVVVAQVLYDPALAEPNNEFLRLHNRSPWSIFMGNHAFTGYKVGDAETIGETGEGMKGIPLGYGNVAPAGYLTIASSAGDLLTNYGITADLECANPNDDPGTVNLTTYTTWATGALSLSITGDEVILLDGCDTVVDVVVYEGGSYAGVASQTYDCAGDEMLFRIPPGRDTDNCASDFAYGTVPVELASFAANVSPDGVTLSWKTATESDNLGFNVYRATGSEDRARLNAELIPGAGTTLDPQTYSFVDEDVTAGQTYRYWLEQVDLTGTSEVFGPITVSVPGTAPSSLRLAATPIPASDGGTLQLSVPQAGPVSVGLYDLTGRLAMTVFQGSLTPGSHSLSWNRGDLASGTYFARAATLGGWVTIPVILE